ncbi:MAG: flagellar basal body P-ring formation chaperone FlgA [bacterium]|nr:flagellar basal body P-ring formation chaperone FlgA [bacterium]
MKRYTILLILFFLFLQGILYASTLKIKSLVTVSGEKVYLRDILDSYSDIPESFLSIELFPAPPVGKSVTYSSQYIKQLLTMKIPALMKDREFLSSEKVIFTRTAQVISKEELLSIVREQTGMPNLELLTQEIPSVVLPEGKLRVEAKQLSSTDSKVLVVKVTFYVDDRYIKAINLSFKSDIKKVLYSAKVYIPKGTIITEDMIQEKTFDSAVFSAVEKKEDIIGKIATRMLYPGQVITSNAIVEPPLVNKNEEVEAVRRVGNLVISTKLIALQDGYFGQTIRLRNPSSYKEVIGTVVGKGMVEVFK